MNSARSDSLTCGHEASLRTAALVCIAGHYFRGMLLIVSLLACLFPVGCASHRGTKGGAREADNHAVDQPPESVRELEKLVVEVENEVRQLTSEQRESCIKLLRMFDVNDNLYASWKQAEETQYANSLVDNVLKEQARWEKIKTGLPRNAFFAGQMEDVVWSYLDVLSVIGMSAGELPARFSLLTDISERNKHRAGSSEDWTLGKDLESLVSDLDRMQKYAEDTRTVVMAELMVWGTQTPPHQVPTESQPAELDNALRAFYAALKELSQQQRQSCLAMLEALATADDLLREWTESRETERVNDYVGNIGTDIIPRWKELRTELPDNAFSSMMNEIISLYVDAGILCGMEAYDQVDSSLLRQWSLSERYSFLEIEEPTDLLDAGNIEKIWHRAQDMRRKALIMLEEYH